MLAVNCYFEGGSVVGGKRTTFGKEVACVAFLLKLGSRHEKEKNKRLSRRQIVATQKKKGENHPNRKVRTM